MAKTNKRIRIGVLFQRCTFVLTAISVVLWLTFLFIPDRYHFECIGTVTKFENGIYKLNDTESHTVESFDYRVTYMPFDGTEEQVVYFHDDGNDIYNHIRRYHEENSWTYVYRYRYGMLHLIYFGMAFVLAIITLAINEDWTIVVEVRDMTDLKYRKKDNSNDRIW